MKISVFGSGYVGLVQAAVLAEAGHQVCCVDVNPKRVADLQAGIIPIYEPGLATLVQQGVAQGLLQFTTDGAAGVAFGELQFIAVGTPPDEDGSADLKYVLSVASTIATQMTSVPSITSWSDSLPWPGLTNCGKNAMKNTATFGLRMSINTPWRNARQADASDSMSSAALNVAPAERSDLSSSLSSLTSAILRDIESTRAAELVSNSSLSFCIVRAVEIT